MSIRSRVEEYTRRLGLGDLRAPTVDAEEFEHVGGFELPKDFQAVVNRANQLESLAAHPGWTIVLDQLEKLADTRLAALKQAEHADSGIVKAMVLSWRESERRIRDMEEIIVTAITARDALLADLSVKYGQDTHDILQEATIVGQMKQQMRNEGMIAIDPDELFSDDDVET